MTRVRGHYRNGRWVRAHDRRTPPPSAAVGAVLVAAALAGGVFYLRGGVTPEAPRLRDPGEQTQAVVVHVIDGDTIVAHTTEGTDLGRIRVLGIDAPETDPAECHAEEATAAAVALLQDQTVHLTGDPTQWERDVYDRLLAYVDLEDGTDFAQHMLTEGHVRQLDHGEVPYQRRDAYQDAQDAAQDHEAGLWGVCQQ